MGLIRKINNKLRPTMRFLTLLDQLKMSQLFLKHAYKIQRKTPSDYGFELKVIDNLIKVGMLEKAKEQTRRVYRSLSVLSDDSPTFKIWKNKALESFARVEYEKLNYQEALRHLNKIKEYHSFDSYILFNEFKARVLFRLNEIDKAHDLYEKIVSADYTTLSKLYLLYFNCIKITRGVDDPCSYIIANKTVPNNYHTKIAFSKYYLENGQIAKAGKLLESVSIPITYEYFLLKAKYNIETGDYRESKKYLRKTMSRGKNFLQAFNLYITINFLQGNRFTAKTLFTLFSMHPNAKRYEGVHRKMAMLNRDVTKVFDSIKDSQGIIGMKAALGHQYCPSLDTENLSGKSMIVLPLWGVGDEMMVLGVYKRLLEYTKEKNVELHVGTEPRFHSLVQRSFPDIHVISVERKYRGPHQNRVGVENDDKLLPNQKLYYSFDYALWEKRAEYDYILALPMVVRDIYGMDKGFKSANSFLIPDKLLVEKFEKRLNDISSKPKVGISWRSGITGQNRSIHYTSIEEWEPIFEMGDKVDFINLQYDDAEKELGIIAEQYGISVYNFPNVDLFNDFESIVAIMANLDFNIAPSSVTAELSGAIGCTTLNMINSAEGLWRKSKNGTDIFHDSIFIITPDQFGDKKSLIDNTANMLNKLLNNTSDFI